MFSTCTAGKWYLVITCAYCQAKFVNTDPDQGKAPARPTYQTTCPKCLRIGSHDREVLELYQHPPMAKHQTA